MLLLYMVFGGFLHDYGVAKLVCVVLTCFCVLPKVFLVVFSMLLSCCYRLARFFCMVFSMLLYI